MLGTMLSLASAAHAFDFMSLITGWLTAVNQTVSSLRVVTKQTSVAADRVSQSARESTSALATAVVANRQAMLTKDAVQRFSSQGVNACFAYDLAGHTAGTVIKTERAQQDIAAAIQNIDYGDAAKRAAAKMDLHNSVYCSVSEHKAGLCKLNMGGMQSADSDFSFVVKDGTKSGSERGAGYDFIDNILPPPVVSRCKGPECAAASRDMVTMNAFDSLARNSMMSIIEARSTQSQN